MKNRVFVALLLAVVLALPAVAQQSGSTTQDQPAASQPATSQSTGTATQDQPAASQPATSQSTGTATQDQPAASQPAQSAPAAPADQNATQTAGPGASGKPALQPDTHEGFWGHLNPFARKKYVQRQTAPIRDRVNELDELTAANSKMIKDVDSRAQEGVRLASTKANEADQPAIDDMATPLKNQRGYIIEVQGFSSGRGTAAIQTSQKMADSVVRYLVLNHEIPVYRIYVVGMGNAPVQTANADQTGKTKRMSGGRVEVSLLKNDLEQLASSSTSPAAAPQGQQEPPK